MTKKLMKNVIFKIEKLLSKIINKTMVVCYAFLLCLYKFKKYESDVSPKTF